VDGIKHDSKKPKMNLLPPKAIVEVAKVLTFGAQKYGPENWKELEDLQNRYLAGALRHIFAHMDGEQLDPETGLSHMAHALCCLLFKLEIELENAKIEEEEPRESDEQQHQARDQSFESDRLYEADNKERSVQHIKHLVQYYTS
tara:strand:- start:241 stop:672 length:432 start_codon:yes stop_codon:yes gene_type:complete